ncbi:MAG: hypothetical protein V4655_07730 [Bdellovibrionota bacterium]
MKLRHSVKWMLVGALVVPHLTACSFGGDGEESEEVEASDEGEAADAGEEGNDVADSEGSEGNVAVEGNSANGEGNVAFDNADANAVAGAEGTNAASDIPPELLNTENTVGAEGTGADGMPVADASANIAPPTDSVPTDSVPAESAPVDAAAAAAPAPVAPGDARVYYVNVASAAIHSGADASSQSVGNVSKGEPVLVKIEGNWANVIGRGYIDVASLSQSPVGRSLAPKSWR